MSEASTAPQLPPFTSNSPLQQAHADLADKKPAFASPAGSSVSPSTADSSSKYSFSSQVLPPRLPEVSRDAKTVPAARGLAFSNESPRISVLPSTAAAFGGFATRSPVISARSPTFTPVLAGTVVPDAAFMHGRSGPHTKKRGRSVAPVYGGQDHVVEDVRPSRRSRSLSGDFGVPSTAVSPSIGAVTKAMISITPFSLMEATPSTNCPMDRWETAGNSSGTCSRTRARCSTAIHEHSASSKTFPPVVVPPSPVKPPCPSQTSLAAAVADCIFPESRGSHPAAIAMFLACEVEWLLAEVQSHPLSPSTTPPPVLSRSMSPSMTPSASSPANSLGCCTRPSCGDLSWTLEAGQPSRSFWKALCTRLVPKWLSEVTSELCMVTNGDAPSQSQQASSGVDLHLSPRCQTVLATFQTLQSSRIHFAKALAEQATDLASRITAAPQLQAMHSGASAPTPVALLALLVKFSDIVSRQCRDAQTTATGLTDAMASWFCVQVDMLLRALVGMVRVSTLWESYSRVCVEIAALLLPLRPSCGQFVLRRLVSTWPSEAAGVILWLQLVQVCMMCCGKDESLKACSDRVLHSVGRKLAECVCSPHVVVAAAALSVTANSDVNRLLVKPLVAITDALIDALRSNCASHWNSAIASTSRSVLAQWPAATVVRTVATVLSSGDDAGGVIAAGRRAGMTRSRPGVSQRVSHASSEAVPTLPTLPVPTNSTQPPQTIMSARLSARGDSASGATSARSTGSKSGKVPTRPLGAATTTFRSGGGGAVTSVGPPVGPRRPRRTVETGDIEGSNQIPVQETGAGNASAAGPPVVTTKGHRRNRSSHTLSPSASEPVSRHVSSEDGATIHSEGSDVLPTFQRARVSVHSDPAGKSHVSGRLPMTNLKSEDGDALCEGSYALSVVPRASSSPHPPSPNLFPTTDAITELESQLSVPGVSVDARTPVGASPSQRAIKTLPLPFDERRLAHKSKSSAVMPVAGHDIVSGDPSPSSGLKAKFAPSTARSHAIKRANRLSGAAKASPTAAPDAEHAKLCQMWGEVEMLLRVRIACDEDATLVRDDTQAALMYLDRLAATASRLSCSQGGLSRVLLPFDTETSASDQAKSASDRQYDVDAHPLLSQLREKELQRLKAGALTMRALVRMKVADDMDLVAARQALNTTAAFFAALEARSTRLVQSLFATIQSLQ